MSVSHRKLISLGKITPCWYRWLGFFRSSNDERDGDSFILSLFYLVGEEEFCMS